MWSFNGRLLDEDFPAKSLQYSGSAVSVAARRFSCSPVSSSPAARLGDRDE